MISSLDLVVTQTVLELPQEGWIEWTFWTFQASQLASGMTLSRAGNLAITD